MLSALPAAGLSGPSRAASFPEKPISLVVPFGPGGATDIVARTLAAEASAQFNQPVVILNKPGASATIGTGEVFRAKPDGYTVLLADNISTVLQPQRMKLPYSGHESFDPVIRVGDVPNVLAVRADARWKTLADFVEDAKTRPGSIRVSTAGQYTGTDLNILELNQIAGMNTLRVPIGGGTGEAVTLLLGGHVEAVVGAPAAIVSFAQAGKLRPLTVFSNQRVALFPELPTTAESGYQTTMRVMVFVSAPKGLEPGTLRALHDGFAAAVGGERFRTFARSNGYLVDVKDSTALRRELDGWRGYFGGLMKRLGPDAAK
ncbi:MAG: tripartite tricarboxylate transporter substrate binding protein [Lautropia sp.]